MVDIVIGGISPIKINPSKEKANIPPEKEKYPRDKRKNKQDRRQSVREGIIVSLSGKNERRSGGDRRKAGS